MRLLTGSPIANVNRFGTFEVRVQYLFVSGRILEVFLILVLQILEHLFKKIRSNCEKEEIIHFKCILSF